MKSQIQRWLAASAMLTIAGFSSELKAQTYTWRIDGDGTWNTTNTNWSLNGVNASWVNGGSRHAVFGDVINANRTISLGVPITAGRLTFSDTLTSTYLLSMQGNNILMDNSGTPALLEVTGFVRGFNTTSNVPDGAHTISPGNLNFIHPQLNVNNNGIAGTTTLHISSVINRLTAGGTVVFGGVADTFFDGNLGNNITTLIKSGTGSLILAGNNSNLTGSIALNQGILQVNNSASLGAASAQVNMAAGSTLRFQAGMSIANRLNINGTVAQPSIIEHLDINAPLILIGTNQLVGSASSGLRFFSPSSFFNDSDNISITGSHQYAGRIEIGSNQFLIRGADRFFNESTSSARTTVTLENNGSLPLSSSFVVNSGSQLNIVQSPVAITGRLGASTPINLFGGGFRYTSSSNGGAAVNESFGPLRLDSTGTILLPTADGSTGGNAITFNGITRDNHATLHFVGSSSKLGGPSGATNINYRVMGLNPLTNLGTPQAQVLPWAAGQDNSQLFPMTYDAQGFRFLRASEYTTVSNDAQLTAAGGHNVRLENISLLGSHTVNSISSTGGSQVDVSGNGRISVDSGLAMVNQVRWNGPLLDFGTARGHLISNSFFDLTGSSSIQGSNGLVISGSPLDNTTGHVVRFTNTVANTFQGGLSLLGDTLFAFNNNNQLGRDSAGLHAGDIHLNGGQLNFAPLAATTITLGENGVGRNITLGALGGTIGTEVQSSQSSNVESLQIPGTISGPGRLNLTTNFDPMIIHFTNPGANTYTGGTSIGQDTVVRLNRGDHLGSGPILLTLNGALQANNPISINNEIYVSDAGVIDTQHHAVTLSNTGGIANITRNAQIGETTLTKKGTGLLNVNAINTFAGNLLIPENQATVRLSGSGSFGLLASARIGTGSVLQLDNSTSYNGNRLGDRTILHLEGGRFDYLAPSTATPSVAEKMGTVNINGFGNVVNMVADTATSPTVLQFRNLLDTLGTVTFRGNNLGGNTGNYTRILFDQAPVLVTGDYLPNAFYANTPGTGSSTQWAGYDFNRGVVPFTPINTSGTIIDNVNPPNTPITAAFATSGNTTAFTGAQIFSLILDNGSNLTLRGAYGPDRNNGFTPEGTLRIKGGYLETRNGAKTIQATSAQAIDFGTTYGTIRTNSDLTFTSDVALNGSRRTLKEGAATLTFNGPVNLTDGLLARQGTMVLGNTATVGPNVKLGATDTGVFTMNAPNQTWGLVSGAGGVINNNASNNTIATVSLLKDARLNVNANTVLPQNPNNENLFESGSTIDIANGRTLSLSFETIHSTVQGQGRLAVNYVILSGNNTFSGGITTTDNVGYVIALHPNAFGTGDVNLTSHTNNSRLVYESQTLFGAIANNILWSTSSLSTHSKRIENDGSQPLQLNGIMSGGHPTRPMTISSPDGYVRLANPNNSFAASVLSVFQSILGITSDGALGASSNSIRFTGFDDAQVGRSATLRFDANNITLNASRTITADFGIVAGHNIDTNGNDATIAGPLAGPLPLTKIGQGRLNLTGTSTHTGNFNLNEGTLLVNGSLAGNATAPQLNTAANTILGGNGVIGSSAARRDVFATGIVAPGNSVGELTVFGNVSLLASSSLDVEIQNTGSPGVAFDSLVINGTFDINPTAVLAGDLLGSFQAPFLSAYTIVNTTGGVLGSFANAPNDGDTFLFDGQVFQIRYNVGTFTVDGTNGLVTTSSGGNIVIAAVPEPTTWALVGISFLGGIWYVWRMQRQKVLASELVID